MPTYEYVCTECGNHTEVVRSHADAPTTCTVCAAAAAQGLLPGRHRVQGLRVLLTDSRGKSGRPAKTDGDKAKTPADTTSSSSDSKAASSDGSGTSTAKPKAAEKSA